MTLTTNTFKVTYAVGALPHSILTVLTDMEPSMENSTEGTGQYEMSQVLEHFDEESEEYQALNALDVDYIEA